MKKTLALFLVVLMSMLSHPTATSAVSPSVDDPAPSRISCTSYYLGDQLTLVSYASLLFQYTATGWERVPVPEAWSILAVAEDRTIYVVGSVSRAIYRSEDRGRTWEKLGALPGSSWKYVSFWPSPDPDVMFAAFVGPTNHKPGLWKSNDGGQNWRLALELPCLDDMCYIGDVVFSPDFETDGIAFLNYDWLAFDGVYRSVDAGETWTKAPNSGMSYPPNYNGGLFLAISPQYAADHTLFSAGVENGGYYRSRDSADSWTQLLAAWPSAIALSPDFGTDHTLLLADQGWGVSISHDAGDTQQRVWGEFIPFSNAPFAVGLSRADPGAAYTYEFWAIQPGPNYDMCRLHHSTDGGLTWFGQQVYKLMIQLPVIIR